MKHRGFALSEKAALGVTLCCIDTSSPKFGYAALLRSLDQFPVKTALFLSHQKPACLDPRIKWIKVRKFRSVSEYSNFILCEFFKYIETSHVLIVQWDGHILDARLWDDEFLDYDYIGAVWPQFSDQFLVGNGGFSLRSRKLLAVLGNGQMDLHHPEDVCICRTNRPKLEAQLGIRFASVDVARRFSFERETGSRETFGFHGIFNFPIAYANIYMKEIAKLPLKLFSKRDVLFFIEKYLISKEEINNKFLFRLIISSLINRTFPYYSVAKLFCNRLFK